MSSREVERSRRRLIVTGSEPSWPAVVESCGARNDVQRAIIRSGERATASMAYVRYAGYVQGDSGAYYAVAAPSRHRRLTSPAALDGGLYGEKLWGRVKVLRLSRCVFTCQNSALHVSEADNPGALGYGCPPRPPRATPDFPSQRPSSPPSPLACHSQISRGAFASFCASRV